MNLERLRINLSDRMVTNPKLEAYYKNLVLQNKSLELDRAICDR